MPNKNYSNQSILKKKIIKSSSWVFSMAGISLYWVDHAPCQLRNSSFFGLFFLNIPQLPEFGQFVNLVKLVNLVSLVNLVNLVNLTHTDFSDLDFNFVRKNLTFFKTVKCF